MESAGLDFDPYDTIFDPNIIARTKLFLLQMSLWVSKGTGLEDRIPRIMVKKITLKKVENNPEHEFLIIHAHDTELNRTINFVLDRSISQTESGLNTPNPEPIAGSAPSQSNNLNTIDKFKKMLSSVHVLFSSSARTESQRDRLTSSDNFSLSLTESADFVSDSLGVSEEFPALDRFMGEMKLRSVNFQGDTSRSMVPTDLTLFDFVVLAHAAHLLHPKYNYLGKQCYFYVALVFGAVEAQWEVCPSDSDETCGGLSDKSGRYKGMKVCFVDTQDIAELLDNFKIVRRETVDLVCLFRSTKLLPLTTAFDTDHG